MAILIFLGTTAVPLLGQGAATSLPAEATASRHVDPKPLSGPYQWTGGHYTYDPAGNVIDDPVGKVQ